MRCPKCSERLPDYTKIKLRFCPVCGERLFEQGEKYHITIICSGQRNLTDSAMHVFVDEKQMYEMMPADKIVIELDSGFHSIKFKRNIRNKNISLLVSANYEIRVYFNTLSGLIETVVSQIIEKKGMEVAATPPKMVSEDGRKTFDILFEEDDPEYDFKTTSGFTEGRLKIYSMRCEFIKDVSLKKEVTNYKDVLRVRKKMGSIEFKCDGNVRKVYSIPKDIYNDVMAFLTNRIQDIKRSNLGEK